MLKVHFVNMYNFVSLGVIDKLSQTQSHEQQFHNLRMVTPHIGERGGSVVECRTPEREVRGSKPTAAVLCP